MTEYKLDAKGKRLGRFATEIAVLLMGKNLPDFSRNAVSKVKVVVENASLLDIDPKKLESKVYQSYSGYPGGRKEVKMSKLIEDKGVSAAIMNAVYGMLPKNKLRSEMIKNLEIKD